MYFSIVESFGPHSEGWAAYVAWRGLTLDAFESIDGMLRCALFHTPNTPTEWAHVVNENCMLHLITDHGFAIQLLQIIGEGDLVGIKLEQHEPNHPQFLGFDLIDGQFDVSLLTNWGNDNTMVNQHLGRNGLIKDLATVQQIQQHLLSEFAHDGHVPGCQIVSVYDMNP
ncbi:hypothetical protein [Marinicella meishanensis]|uniref:hypothetical protein n=1 Tax=Marinicella meishanensis TaxID=2873263 RepID=UPI001CC1A0C9|nr:hypothetical protein [Marinicella sp. NBU2979]